MTLILFLFVVSYSISTSNHNLMCLPTTDFLVVSYSISTSNHNNVSPFPLLAYVVSYSISTSNHNTVGVNAESLGLYLIPFLHQTTTVSCLFKCKICCILFHFYIKPQQKIQNLKKWISCILFHFYIKPQLSRCFYP